MEIPHAAPAGFLLAAHEYIVAQHQRLDKEQKHYLKLEAQCRNMSRSCARMANVSQGEILPAVTS